MASRSCYGGGTISAELLMPPPRLSAVLHPVPAQPQRFTRVQAGSPGSGPSWELALKGAVSKPRCPPSLPSCHQVLLVSSPQCWARRCEGTVAASLPAGFQHGEAMALPSVSQCRPSPGPSPIPAGPGVKCPLTGTALLSQNHVMRTPTCEMVWVFFKYLYFF